MTPDQIEQVFGRGRLKMATGEHVEVFREAIAPGERRRYTKRFLATSDSDFGPWTEREWRILARLIGHGVRCVPDVVQFDGGAMGGARLVQTYDAGITVDQWGTLLPVARNGETHTHVFEDCAHWWALAHHCLAALDEIHALGLVHLDIKGDNICIPCAADFDPDAPTHRLRPEFGRLALIDFAFSLVSRESLAMPLPIGWQKDYDYQSPRLLRALDAGRSGDLEPTKELDWRCDLYSLAAMLKRYLPTGGRADEDACAAAWTAQRYDDARTLIFRLRDSHDRDLPHWRPHAQFMDYTSTRLDARDLAASLADGWTLARDTVAAGIATPMTPITPMTRIAPAIRNGARMRATPPAAAPTAITVVRSGRARALHANPQPAPQRDARRVPRRALPVSIALASLVAIATPSFVGDPQHPLADRARALVGAWRMPVDRPIQDIARAPGTAPPVAGAPQPVAGLPDIAPPIAPTGHEADADARVADSPEAGAPREAASPTPVPAESMVAAATPVAPGSTAAAAPQADAAPAAATPTEPQRPATATKPTAHPKTGTAGSRGQPAKRPATTAAKPATGVPAKALADTARRATARASAAERSRTPAPSVRVDIAGATSALPRPSSIASAMAPAAVHSSSKSAESSSDRVAQHVTPPVAITSAPSETDSRLAAAETARPNAAPAPPAWSSSALASSEPSIAQTDMVGPPSAARAKPRDDWRAQLAGFFGLFRNRNGPPAPVEDRTAQAGTNRQAVASRALAQAATDALARAAPVPDAAAAMPAPLSAARPTAVTVPLVTEPVAQAPAAAAISPRDSDARAPDAGGADVAVAAAPAARMLVRSGPFYIPAPTAVPPTRTVAAPRDYPRDEPQDLALQARRLLVDTVPRVAAQAEPDLSRVLTTAATAHHPAQARLVVEAADGPWPSESAWIPVVETPGYARRLHNEARRTVAAGGDIAEAVNVELQAFAANPRDPDIAGYLALLHLRMSPARPETARLLAMHSIALSGSRRSTRYAEWSTFAVASALTGRDADATRAFLAEAALTTNVDRSCQAALRAYASYGERLRAPVLALLQRVNAQGRAYDTPSCMWPAYWNAAARAGGAF